MKRLLFVAIALFACLATTERPVWGQLFGQRNLGNPLARRPTAGSSKSRSGASGGSGGQAESNRLFDESTFENVGSLDESARYLRGNHDVTDFVGAATGETRRFVGSQLAEAAVEITSATDDLEIETADDANMSAEPAVPGRLPLNPPRLQLGFSPVSRLESVVSLDLTDRLRDILTLDDAKAVQVSMQDNVVVLVGEVPTERDRKLAELLLRLEPGVNAIDNRLKVEEHPIPDGFPVPPPPVQP